MWTKEGFQLSLTSHPSTKISDTLLLQCIRCGRWGNVYSTKKLTPTEKEDIAKLFRQREYVCGARLSYVKENEDDEDDYEVRVHEFLTRFHTSLLLRKGEYFSFEKPWW